MPKTTNLAPEEITNKDVTKAYLRWHFANEIPHSFERYLAPSLLYAMMPLLKKLYKDDEQLKAAYMRQLLFFITQLSWRRGHYWADGFHGNKSGPKKNMKAAKS